MLLLHLSEGEYTYVRDYLYMPISCVGKHPPPTNKHVLGVRAYQLCGVYLFAQHFEFPLTLINVSFVLFYVEQHILLLLVEFNMPLLLLVRRGLESVEVVLMCVACMDV